MHGNSYTHGSSGSDWQLERTDPLGWRLVVSEDSHGQHKWVYLPEGPQREEWPQSQEAKYWSGMEFVCSPAFQICSSETS